LWAARETKRVEVKGKTDSGETRRDTTMLGSEARVKGGKSVEKGGSKMA